MLGKMELFLRITEVTIFYRNPPTPAESPVDTAELQCSTLDCTAAQWLLSSAMASKVIPRYLMAHYKPLYRNNTDMILSNINTTLSEKNWIQL